MRDRTDRIGKFNRELFDLRLRIRRDKRPVYTVLDYIKRSAESCGDNRLIHRKRLGHRAAERLGLTVIGAYDNIGERKTFRDLALGARKNDMIGNAEIGDQFMKFLFVFLTQSLRLTDDDELPVGRLRFGRDMGRLEICDSPDKNIISFKLRNAA